MGLLRKPESKKKASKADPVYMTKLLLPDKSTVVEPVEIIFVKTKDKQTPSGKDMLQTLLNALQAQQKKPASVKGGK